MSQIIKPDKEGALHLSSELLGPTPHARYIIERSGEVIVLRPRSPTCRASGRRPALRNVPRLSVNGQ